ncbi:MAG: glycosyltransferase family 2 protein [Elusimicrobia bacterium]|nr:glycosyltransferase family 2 protein [Elusimicrobiota bacterium]
MNLNPLLSISIVSYNTKDLLYNCLKSIYTQIRDINFEVIVVDNNSSDGSQEMVKKEFSQVRLILNTVNNGFGKANNQAIRESKGKYILLLNSDTVIINDIVKKMIDFMESNLQTGVAGCKLLRPDMTIQPMTNFAFNIWTEFARFFNLKKIIYFIPGLAKFTAKYFAKFMGKNYKSYFNSYLVQNKVQKVDYVSGACLMARKNVVMDIGLFDEKFFLYYEDVDLCLRIKQKGWIINLLPETGIVHHIGQSSKKELWKISGSMNASMYYYYKKHNSFIEVLLIKIIAISALSLRNIYLLIFYPISKDKRKTIQEELKSNMSFIKLSIYEA